MRKIAFLFLVLGCFLSSPGYAGETADAQGASVLKKLVEENLQWRLDMAKNLGQGLVMTGSLQVMPKGDFYEVRLPGLSVNFGPQGRLEIGTIVIHAKPGRSAPDLTSGSAVAPDHPGEWLISAALPSPMTVYDAGNAPVAEISVGEQRFAGAWWPEWELLSKMDAFYDNVLFKSLGEGLATATIGSIAGTMNLKNNADGTWTGPAAFDVSDIMVGVGGKTTAQGFLHKMHVISMYDRLDMRQAQETRKNIRHLFQDGKTPTPEEFKALLSSELLKMQIPMDSMSSSIDINGVSILQKNPQPDAPPLSITLGMASFQGGVQGARQEKARINFKNSFSNLKVSFVPADIAGLVPHEMSIEISADNLPLKQITSVMYGAFQQLAHAPDAGQGPVLAAVSSLPKILSESGATVSVSDSFIRSDDLDTSFSGKVEANAAADLGATGKFDFFIKGLEGVMKKMTELAAKPGANGKWNNYINGLTFVQGIGQIETGADGETMRAYHFEMTPTGSIKLNGVDVRVKSPAVPAPAPVPVP